MRRNTEVFRQVQRTIETKLDGNEPEEGQSWYFLSSLKISYFIKKRKDPEREKNSII